MKTHLLFLVFILGCFQGYSTYGQGLSAVYNVTDISEFNTLDSTYETVVYDGSMWTFKTGAISSNNGLMVQAGSYAHYERVYNKDRIMGRWFGLKSDTTFDATSILQNMVNIIPDGSTIIIPSGVLQTSAISIAKAIRLVGEEPDALWKIQGTVSIALKFENLNNVGVSSFYFYKIANTTTTTAVQFIGCTNASFDNNHVSNMLQAVVFTGSSYLSARQNRVENTYYSGIRFSKDSLASLARTCNYAIVEHNVMRNNDISLIAGHGAIFLGADGANEPHTNFKIHDNIVLDQNKMCIAADGRVINLSITNNTMIQGATATSGEVVALGGGSGSSGMKKVIVSGNYFEQPVDKTAAANLVVYSNVTDLTITGNRFKEGPQGIFFHFPMTTSLIGDVTVSNNTFNNCSQGILFFKDSGVTLTDMPYNIIISDNYFWNCTSFLEYSSLPTTAQTFTVRDNFVDGRSNVRGSNLSSISSLPQESWPGFYEHTSTTDATIQGSTYVVNPTSVTGATTILLGATANYQLPDQKFAGIGITFSGSFYNNVGLDLYGSYGATRKKVANFYITSGSVPIMKLNGLYNDQLLQLRNSLIWSSSDNKLRVKTSTPTSDTDGDYFLKNTDAYDKSGADARFAPIFKRTIVSDVNYTILTSDYLVAYSSLTAARSATLPSANSMANKELIIKDETGLASTYAISIIGTIDGVTKTINTNYGALHIYSTGSAWYTK